jgi:hypothetical protein
MPAKKTVKKTGVKRKPPNAGKGRPKGSKNVATLKIKDAILNAFTEVGGEKYLVKVAREDPKTFCGLIAKVMPVQIEGTGNEQRPILIQLKDLREAANGGSE